MSALNAMRKYPHMLAAGAALALCLALSACSLDKKEGEAFVENVKQKADSANFLLNYQKYKINGHSVILTDASLSPKVINGQTVNLADSPSAILLGTVRFDGVAPEKDGGFSVKEITAGNDTDKYAGKYAGKKSDEILVHRLKISSVHFFPRNTDFAELYSKAGFTKLFERMLPYKLTIQNLSAISDTKKVADIDNSSLEMTKTAKDSYEYKLNIGSYTGYLSAFPSEDAAQMREQFASLGYADTESIKASYSLTGLWNRKTGIVNLTNNLSIDKIGGYSFSAEFSGISQPFLAVFKKVMQTSAADSRKLPPDYTAAFAEAHNLIKFIVFDKAELVYHDDSLMGHILDTAGKENGQTRAECAAAIKKVMRNFVQQLLKESGTADTDSIEFAAYISRAVDQIGIFLDNPRSLRLTANPQNPVSLTEIYLMGMLIYVNPYPVIKRLNLQLDANAE